VSDHHRRQHVFQAVPRLEPHRREDHLPRSRRALRGAVSGLVAYRSGDNLQHFIADVLGERMAGDGHKNEA
jgi:hypothetical protein